MDYSSDGYPSKVQQVKKKNYTMPIVIVLLVAVIAAGLIYYAIQAARTTSVTGDSLTVENIYGYEQKIESLFYLEEEDFTLLEDGTVTVEDGAITDLGLVIAIDYYGSKESWKVADSSDGIDLTYKKRLDSDEQGCYTLADFCGYLVGIHGIVGGQLSISTYTASFGTVVCSAVQSGGYLWNGEDFELLTADVAADCYPITVTAGNGVYMFYV